MHQHLDQGIYALSQKGERGCPICRVQFESVLRLKGKPARGRRGCSKKPKARLFDEISVATIDPPRPQFLMVPLGGGQLYTPRQYYSFFQMMFEEQLQHRLHF